MGLRCIWATISDIRVFFLSSTACGLTGCWLSLGCWVRHLGASRVPSTVVRRGWFLCWVVCLLDFFWVSFWPVLCVITCISFGFRPPASIHHRPPQRVSISSVVGPAFRRICMSDQAIRELAAAVSRLALAIEGHQSAGPVVLPSLPSSASAEYEIVCVYPPSLPCDPDTWTSHTRSLAFRTVEEGPPDIPGFCWNLGFQNLGADKEVVSRKVSSAFVAGFWARAAVDCATPYDRREPPTTGEIIRHFVVLRSSYPHPFRVTCWQDLADICDVTDRLLVFESFATFTEVQLFCAGTRWEIPALKRWRRRSWSIASLLRVWWFPTNPVWAVLSMQCLCPF